MSIFSRGAGESFGAGILAALLLIAGMPLAHAVAVPVAVLPDAPIASPVASSLTERPSGREPGNDESADLSPDPASSQATTPVQQPTPGTTGSPAPVSPSDQKEQSEEQLKQEEHQRIMGVMPAFNSVTGGVAVPLTPGQKFQLMFRSTTDPYVFGFAAVTAGIGQARDSFSGYGQGAEGYFKRFGAAYADTADGNLWGNAILPVLLHEDPRYFRKGSGTFTKRLLYSMSTTVICRRDNGTTGPNYANLAGNLIAGGISNLYYPESDRDIGLTFQNAATVTAEGMIGAFLLEFWPDVARHYSAKKQAKLDAAAAADHINQTANPTGKPPQ